MFEYPFVVAQWLSKLGCPNTGAISAGTTKKN